MALQLTPNTRQAGNLNITANQRARMSSVLSIDWDHVTGKPGVIDAIGNVAGTGLLAITTADGVSATRTITGTANEVTLTNGDGVAGNPVVSLPSALTFTGKTITGGTYASVVSINGNFWTAGTGRLTLGAGKTATISNTLTLAGTDGTTMTFPTTSATLARTDAGQTFTGTQTMTTVAGGSAAGSTLTLESTTNGSPSGDFANLYGSTITIGSPSNVAVTVNLGSSVGGGVALNVGNSNNGVSAYNMYNSTGGKQVWVPGAGSGTTPGTITFPAATDQLVARATTDTLTNKTINGASNTLTVRLASDVSGNLPVTNLNGGTSASSSTFWRGDGTWSSSGSFTAAVQSDMETGTSTTVGVVPGVQKYHPAHPKAWAYVTQAAGVYTLAANFGITSINKTGTGVVQVNLTTAMSSTSFAVMVNTTGASSVVQANAVINSASQVTVNIIRSSTEAATDSGFSIAFFGDQ